MSQTDFSSLPTPSLLLDIAAVRRNAARISRRVHDLKTDLRPHVKTHKCVEIARIQTAGHSGGITVSTLAEAEAFAAAGFRDITYAVPIEPGKFERAAAIAKRIDRLALNTDDGDIPPLLDAAAARNGVIFDLFVEVDCGDHRCGIAHDSPELTAVAAAIHRAENLRFAGLLTHAGHSYHAWTREERLAIARRERDVMLDRARVLAEQGFAVPVLSIGSTPTIVAVDHLDGIREVRPGNYIFFDAFQQTQGNCDVADCALTVLAAVVHRDRGARKVVIDAGAIALSKDRGAVEFTPDAGYGRVLDLEGNPLGAQVTGVSQEHGEIRVADDAILDRLKVGTRIRILANHSCLTAAQHDRYHVVENGRLVDQWRILRGW